VGNEEEIRASTRLLECTKSIADMRRSCEDARERERDSQTRKMTDLFDERESPAEVGRCRWTVHGEENTGK
jgi:hypothetical protein